MTNIDLQQTRSDLNEYMIICEKYEHCLEKYGSKLNHEGCSDVCWHGRVLKDIDQINSNVMIYNCANNFDKDGRPKKHANPLCFVARKDTLKDVQPVVEEGPWKDSNFKL
jgi:hypothetical protein